MGGFEAKGTTKQSNAAVGTTNNGPKIGATSGVSASPVPSSPAGGYTRTFDPDRVPWSQRLDSAVQPVAVPVPKPASDRHAAPVDTQHAPSVDGLLDPQRPSLEGVNQEIVVQAIEGIVKDIYDSVFLHELALLEVDLAKTAPPRSSPFALVLLGWVVEMVANWTIGSLGKLAAKHLFGAAAPAADSPPKGPPTPVEMTIMAFGGSRPAETTKPPAQAGSPTNEAAMAAVGTSASAKVGAALNNKVTEPRPTTAPDATATPPATAESLLGEFMKRQRSKLLEKKHDAVTTLAILESSAAGTATRDYIELDSKLRTLIGSAELIAWFRQKVTMEWLNFVARVSLGPRAAGQNTDMIGANVIDGIAAEGTDARKQWLGSEGFVEIAITVPDHVDGLHGVAIQKATVPSSFGAMTILKHGATDQSGQPYDLSTLPLYRRVWLRAQSSKLSESPAFVITPDGQIEADVSNPILAAIGSGQPTPIGDVVHVVGGHRFTDEEKQNPNAWRDRAVASTQSIIGAHRVRDVLRGASPGKLQ